MSRFAKHMRIGTHVQQGDVIGYVGMTGLATGPHLHYEYLINGVHKNPQTVQLAGAEPLHAEALQRFRSRGRSRCSRTCRMSNRYAAGPLAASTPTRSCPGAGPLASG